MQLLSTIRNLLTKSETGWQGFFLNSTQSTLRKPSEMYYGIVYSCIDAIANHVAKNEWYLWDKKREEKVTDHEAITLLKKPNALQTDTDFIYLMSSWIDTHGQAFIYPIKTMLASKRIVELRLLPPQYMRTKFSFENMIEGYEFTTPKGNIKYEASELINMLRPNPFSMYTGLSTIHMAQYEANNDLDSLEWDSKYYQNGAVPSGVIKTDQAMMKDTFGELKSRIRQQYEGKKNAFKLMFLTHGFEYQQVSLSQRDMQYIDKRKLNRDQILSIFKVPKSLVAVSDQVNRATAETEYAAFAENVVLPRLELIFDKLNKFYLPLFTNSDNLEFRYENPVPSDKEYSLKQKAASVGVWKTPNEIRLEEGLEPIDGGDTLYLVAGASLGMDTGNEPTDDDTTGDKSKEALPNPAKIKNRKHHTYTARRNKYLTFKENQLSLKLNQHFQFFIRDLKREEIKKAVSFDNEDEDLSVPEIEQAILPKKEEVIRWTFLLYLLLHTKCLETSETCRTQLSEVFAFKDINGETMEHIIEHQAKETSNQVTKTMLERVRSQIRQDVDRGITDLKEIKKDVVRMLSDAKEWKVDQIARTELVSAYEQTQRAMYQENGVEKVKWLASADSCAVCMQNNNEVVEIGNAFPSGHSFAGEPHPNCTCETVPVV